MIDISGVIVVDKPSGISSHDVIDFIRRRFKLKKAGHCGTLDPIATGVLVILIGKSTKLSAHLSADDKEYICSMSLGVSTDTHDSTGRILKTADSGSIPLSKIKDIIHSFKGHHKQLPPMHSAKHHKGKRLYKLARKGIEIERKPQDIEIREIEVSGISGPDINFKVSCSKGTYIRTLCNDIGEMLGCGGHMTALRRVRSGNFRIESALTLDELGRMDVTQLYNSVIPVFE